MKMCALPDYAGAVACCGDPRPTVEQLTRALDEQVPPRITSPSDDVAEHGNPDDDGDGDSDA